MDYPFENLDPESFQQVCQALLTREFPNLLCFPVAQPDGGRDAVSYGVASPDREFVVFQVKFARRPHAEEDPHKWLLGILEDEAPKVAKQLPAGAKRFFLLTNVPGTAHPDVGSIDKVGKLLAKWIPIPAYCWWRDDLCRRMDNAWDLKWVYPQLMTGPDLIRSIVESGLAEDKDRRTSAIRAMVTDQYARDEEVRFKQVELQNRLLDLFIDVPVSPSHGMRTRKDLPSLPEVFRHVEYDLARRLAAEEHAVGDLEHLVEGGHDSATGREDTPALGAASLLLHAATQRYVPQVVLEGAPGQGKSTISQYIAQVHRMQILGKKDDLATLPSHHRNVPVRLPLKVDLRDLATWLGKRNPFVGDGTEAVPDGWQKSLEAFLAGLVRHHSGGVTFDVADLHAVSKVSALLLIFDGLDEIADIPRRSDVVEEIVRGIRRLKEVAVSLQVIVTSRPAAFAGSPGFPDDSFPYCQLEAVTRPLIDEYTEKWLRARRLPGRESSDVRRILNEKLDQPHLRDLARNPMQLAIVLSLIHTRGSSLPDKRTALYDNYVELFFSREAEKSVVVREHRDLLVEIHQFLAWTLHAQAEEGQTTGSISTDGLQRLLSEYLEKEGHDPTLCERLFQGVVERVVALVSRVEGTFEFEVQPLREYFAARYLYQTAPYSPPGGECQGTKPDRFDAIAKNFYWLNVTRFYAGCYSKGELPSLVDRLQVLAKDNGYRLISHPRILAATLLADWVFAQHPRSVREVVNLVLDGLGLRFMVTSTSRRLGRGTTLVLPKHSGRDELVDRCLSILRDNPPLDYAGDVLDVLRGNTTSVELDTAWKREAGSASGLDRTRWFEYGVTLGVLPRIPLTELESLTEEVVNTEDRMSAVLQARRWDYADSTDERRSLAIDLLLNRDQEAGLRPRVSRHYLEHFSQVLLPLRWSVAFHSAQPTPLTDVWKTFGPFPDLTGERSTPGSDSTLARKCLDTINIAERESQATARSWATEITHWDNLIEGYRGIWGNRWVIFHLAVVASGIRSSSETCTDCPSLFEDSKSLCRRARYGRLRAGLANWWVRQIAEARDEVDRMFVALLLLTWGSNTVLAQLASNIDELVSGLSPDNWRRLCNSVMRVAGETGGRERDRGTSFDVEALPRRLSPRSVTALGVRSKAETQQALYSRYLQRYRGADDQVLEFIMDSAISLLLSNPTGWKHRLDAIARSYASGVVSERYAYQHLARRVDLSGMTEHVATEIASSPERFPAHLIAIAETRCRQRIASRLTPVARIAREEGWTFS